MRVVETLRLFLRSFGLTPCALLLRPSSHALGLLMLSGLTVGCRLAPMKPAAHSIDMKALKTGTVSGQVEHLHRHRSALLISFPHHRFVLIKRASKYLHSQDSTNSFGDRKLRGALLSSPPASAWLFGLCVSLHLSPLPPSIVERLVFWSGW